MGADNYLKWKGYHFDKLEKINYMGHEFKAPNDRKERVY